jgi:hypothetical protein
MPGILLSKAGFLNQLLTLPTDTQPLFDQSWNTSPDCFISLKQDYSSSMMITLCNLTTGLHKWQLWSLTELYLLHYNGFCDIWSILRFSTVNIHCIKLWRRHLLQNPPLHLQLFHNHSKKLPSVILITVWVIMTILATLSKVPMRNY